MSMSAAPEVRPPEKSAESRPSRAARSTTDDLGQTLTRLKDAQLRDGPPSLKERRRRLEKLERAVVAHQEVIATAMREDFGNKARLEALMSEVYLVVSGARHAREHVREWMATETRDMPLPLLPAHGEVIPQPVGVVGIVSPWNYPINLALLPLVGAIAAGNRAMLKPSELVPKTSAVLADIVRTAFDPDVVTVIQGDALVGEAFTRLPFDHLVFTGSTRVGRLVMKAASDNLVPVTLELGGKSPVLLGPDANIREVAERVMAGKVWNAGQTCVAPDYLLATSDVVESFVTEARRAIKEMLPRMVDNPDYTSIVSDKHYARLLALIAEAREKEARIEELNSAGEVFPAESRKLAPTLIVGGPADSMTVMQEEIFGPILPIVTVKSLDEAIAFVNARPRPLALYYFGHKAETIDYVLARTSSGGVSVNDTMLHGAADELPFGGIGASGMGAYHGKHGFDAFTKLRPVFYQSRVNARKLLAPPFGKMLATAMRVLIGK